MDVLHTLALHVNADCIIFIMNYVFCHTDSNMIGRGLLIFRQIIPYYFICFIQRYPIALFFFYTPSDSVFVSV